MASDEEKLLGDGYPSQAGTVLLWMLRELLAGTYNINNVTIYANSILRFPAHMGWIEQGDSSDSSAHPKVLDNWPTAALIPVIAGLFAQFTANQRNMPERLQMLFMHPELKFICSDTGQPPTQDSTRKHLLKNADTLVAAVFKALVQTSSLWALSSNTPIGRWPGFGIAAFCV